MGFRREFFRKSRHLVFGYGRIFERIIINTYMDIDIKIKTFVKMFSDDPWNTEVLTNNVMFISYEARIIIVFKFTLKCKNVYKSNMT